MNTLIDASSFQRGNPELADTLLKAVTPPQEFFSGSGDYTSPEACRYGAELESVRNLFEHLDNESRGSLYVETDTLLEPGTDFDISSPETVAEDCDTEAGLLIAAACRESLDVSSAVFAEVSEIAGTQISFTWSMVACGGLSAAERRTESGHIDPSSVLQDASSADDGQEADWLLGTDLFITQPSIVVVRGGRTVTSEQRSGDADFYTINEADSHSEVDAVPIIMSTGLIPHGEPIHKGARFFYRARGALVE